MDEPNIVLQPHLGRVKENYKPQNEMGGYLALAKIIKVHHKNRTVDVSIVNTRDVISSDAANEGRFAARVTSSNAGFDQVQLSTSGVIEPIQPGDLALLAFLDNSKTKPVILGFFHNTDDPHNNILPLSYPIDPDSSIEEHKEALKYLRVLPSQFYLRVDGDGGMEVSHPSGTFLKVDHDESIGDGHNQFEHKDLKEKDPQTGNTRSGYTEESTLPVRMLFSHKDSNNDDTAGWTKFFIDVDGTFRTTRDNNDGTLTYMELNGEGSFKIRRQTDSHDHEGGSDSAEVSIGTDGSIEIKRGDTTITIGPDNKMTLSSTQDIEIENGLRVGGGLSVGGSLSVAGSVSASGMSINGVRVATINDIY